MKKIIKDILRSLLLYSFEKKLSLFKILFQILFLIIISSFNLNKIFKNKKKIIFLSHQRFRGDVEVINKKFCGLIIPYFLQTFLLFLAFNTEKKIEISNFFSKSNKEYKFGREKLRNLLCFYLIPVLKLLKVKIIISPSIHYIQDIDIGIAGKMKGINFLIFHRENLTIIPNQIKALVNLYSQFDKINLDLVIFHNEKTKEIFLKSKLLNTNQTMVLGGLRMDDFLKNLNHQNNGKIISFFSFHKISSIPTDINNRKNKIDRFKKQKKGWNKLWDDMHIMFFELAKNNPNKEFILKTKWGGSWISSIEKLWVKKFNSKSLPNLLLTSDYNTHDLINKSKLVLSFNSTVLLESGLRRIPVFVPDFLEVKILNKYVLHKYFPGCFIKLKKMNNLEKVINNKLLKFYPSKKMMQKRKYFFKKYVNPLDKNLKKKYFFIIKKYLLLKN